MPVYRFFWYDENTEHVEEHDVSIDDFEAIVCDPLDTETSRSSDRLVSFGYAEDGRKLVCVYEMIDETTILPVTAYEVE
jgi:uncharacterized DUF497 family protein